MLESLDVPAFKIASTDTSNIPLLTYIAKKSRPMILSSAMATMNEHRRRTHTVAYEATGTPTIVERRLRGHVSSHLPWTRVLISRRANTAPTLRLQPRPSWCGIEQNRALVALTARPVSRRLVLTCVGLTSPVSRGRARPSSQHGPFLVHAARNRSSVFAPLASNPYASDLKMRKPASLGTLAVSSLASIG